MGAMIFSVEGVLKAEDIAKDSTNWQKNRRTAATLCVLVCTSGCWLHDICEPKAQGITTDTFAITGSFSGMDETIKDNTVRIKVQCPLLGHPGLVETQASHQREITPEKLERLFILDAELTPSEDSTKRLQDIFQQNKK